MPEQESLGTAAGHIGVDIAISPHPTHVLKVRQFTHSFLGFLGGLHMSDATLPIFQTYELYVIGGSCKARRSPNIANGFQRF